MLPNASSLKLLVLTFLVLHKSDAFARKKRQIPGLGGPGSFASLPGLGSLSGLGGPSTGSGIASIPGLSQPTIVQPAANKPCPVALVPQQFGGGLKFGNPFNFGFDLKGQDGKEGPWGTGFDTSFGEEFGGSIFGDAGHQAVPLECKNPPGGSSSQQTSGSGSSSGGSLPSNADNPIAKVLAENPDLLRKALQQNPDLLKGQANRAQVEAALTSDPELIRQTLLQNPELIQGALSQAGSTQNGQVGGGNSQATADPALKNAVIRRLVKDSTVMRRFVEEHGYSIREGIKRTGITRTFSDKELMELMASNPTILEQVFMANPGLVAQTASKYRISEDWDKLPISEKWGGPQAAVYDAFSKDPFLLEHVLVNEPLYLKAAMRKGQFDTGDLSDDQVRQVLYDHPEYVKAMLSRDSVFTKHIQKKYGVVAGKEYTRENPSRAEYAYNYLRGSDVLMDKTFRENPTYIENAVKKQKVDPSKVTMDQILDSYKRRPEMLKLMLLQNPEFVTKVINEYDAMVDRKEIQDNGFLANDKEEATTPRVKIRTGRINTQFMRESVQPGESAVQLGG